MHTTQPTDFHQSNGQIERRHRRMLFPNGLRATESLYARLSSHQSCARRIGARCQRVRYRLFQSAESKGESTVSVTPQRIGVVGLLINSCIDGASNDEIQFFLCSICDEFEEMSMHAGERPKETAEVVALQNYLAECRDERIFKLKDEIKKAAERVIFLLHHATLDGGYSIRFDAII